MNKLDFVKFISEFRNDLKNEDSNWTNRTLEDFLEAMEAYTKDIQGYYDQNNLNVDSNKPTWENFKNILKGASVYE